MMKDINAEIDLRQKISSDSGRIVTEIRAEIGELETEYIKARKEQKVGIFLLVLAFVLPYIFGSIETDTFSVLLILAVFFCSVYYGFKLFFGKMWLIKKYNVSVNKIIFAKALSLLGLSGQIVEDGEAKLNRLEKTLNLLKALKDANSASPISNLNDLSQSDLDVDGQTREKGESNSTKMERAIKHNLLKSLNDTNTPGTVFALADLDKSELITEAHNTNQVDNILEINYKESMMRIAELDIKHFTGSGKNRHTKQIFHGYLVVFDLKKELTGKTFVSTEGDKHGFGNQSIFGMPDAGEARETLLEWNEFEDLLHVATTDEVEARYILTPNFMHDLHDWWKGRESNIRLSFIENRLYILYPDNKIRLNQTVEKITDEAITEYIHTITWPLQNVIKLIDDVRL